MSKRTWQAAVLVVAISLLWGGWPVWAQHSGHGLPSASDEDADLMEESPLIHVSPKQQQLIGMRTEAVDWRSLQRRIRTVGRLEASERALATVNAKVEGWIEKLYVDTTGAYVRAGDPLLEIYSPELMAAQQEFLLALRWVRSRPASEKLARTELSAMMAADAQAVLDAARQRLLLWDISQDQIKLLEHRGSITRTLTLYSPANGYITQKMAISGMRVMPGDKLFDIADLSSIWVIADLYEYESSLVKPGDAATVTLAYLPGREFATRIDFIYPEISQETRTVRIRLKLDNPDHRLKPRMFANVEIHVGLGKRLSIPESAVIDTGRGMVVYVDLGGGDFEPREIKTGLRAGGYIEVLRGLDPGDRVATSANFLIDSEAQLKGIRPLPLK